ncbi:DUF6384 family protein [Pseudoduganella sp. LjRoot289]|uniref:DUF6384 family protein n=1 Tax=Pseudoduganella sp. LjRoot289 TaxID=3342314 RepID=UPI003ECF4BF1
MAGALSEQLGAMALIDELRHRQMVVSEQLDLPRRRAEVGQRIRDYYAAQNIAVDEELIGQGVRAYFDGRLRFVPATPGMLAGLLARAYVRRGEQARAMRYALGACLAGAAVWAGAVYVDDSRLHRAGRERVVLLSGALDAARERQKQAGALARQLGSRVAAAQPPLAAAAPLLAQAQLDLSQAAPVLQGALPDPDAIRRGNGGAFLAQVDRRRAEVAAAQALLERGQGRLQRLEQLLAARSGLTQLQRQYSEAAQWEAPPIRRQVRAVQRDLEQPGGAGATAAMDGLLVLGRQLADAGTIAGDMRDLQASSARFDKMGLPAEDRARVAALRQAAAAAAARLDAAQVTALAAEARSLLEFARLPLTIRVADRQGVRSGVERNYNASGGKSWYLIVEALDADGRAVPAPVRSVERGASGWAKLWGVRVSREEYLKVKAEKQSSGHVDSLDMGGKAANTLTVHYARTLKPEPDMITEW